MTIPTTPQDNWQTRFEEASQGMFERIREEFPTAAPVFKKNMLLFSARERTRLLGEVREEILRVLEKYEKMH